MDNQTIINSLRDKIAEIENTIDWMEKSGQIHPIDFDLLLKKTRDLYERIIRMAGDAADEGSHKPILSKSKIIREKQDEDRQHPQAQVQAQPKQEPEKQPENQKEFQHPGEQEALVEPPLFFKAPVLSPEPVQSQPKPTVIEEPVPVKPTPAVPPRPKPTVQETQSHTVHFQREESLNDALRKQKPIQDLASAITETPVADIWSAIAINDRFLFTRELFGNDSESFKTTVSLLNSISSWEAAQKYLTDHFSWDKSSPVSKDFLTVIRRRFI